MINENDIPNEENQGKGHLDDVVKVDGLYESWFLDYASYVILDRAVPNMYDGLKPVQRRILHSLKEMDDGRFNKAANVIGNTMKYHPHGDASIGDAMVNIGQKQLLIDTQGNWGDPVTGDSAAAPRYIEARLSKFANDVVFNPQTTDWQLSYDGRNQEPVTLPVKFPLVLSQGTEGIAVGLATKILPHNFIELIDASIGVLRGVRPDLVPDFPTGGSADVSKYSEGQRGGRVRVRAKINEKDKKTLVINEIPFGTTTIGLIDSIIAANDKGKIKIKKIEDNTAKDVEIVIHLAPGISPDITIDALYAFTNCEMSLSPNTCVIKNDKPHFMSVNDILTECTQHTKELLKQELEIRLAELKEKIFFSSLLKIFIQEGMYKHPEYESSGTFDVVVGVLNKLFAPFFSQFYREILPEDYKKLIDKPMSSITRFDVKKADEQMKTLQEEIDEVNHHLAHLIDYAIDYFERLRAKYGKGRERKTELRTFDTVQAAQVALANVKLYVNKEEGFVGTSLKKDEYVCDCSDIDDIIAFRADGKFLVSKVSEKAFMGKNIVHVGVFKKNDDRTVYNMIYRDGTSGTSYMKRFPVGGITRDKEYDLTKGTKGSAVLWFTANANGEAEVVNLQLKPHSKLRKLQFDVDFSELAIKGRGSQGNVVTKYPIKKVAFKSAGVSTLAGRKIWFDDVLQRLNADGRGKYLGSFSGEDKIITVYKNGEYELMNFDLTNHFDDGLLIIRKFDPEMVLSVVHFEGKAKNFFVKRFVPDNVTIGKKVSFISDESGSKLVLISADDQPRIALTVLKGKAKDQELSEINLTEFIDIKGLKANGNRLSQFEIAKVELLEPVEEEETDVAEDNNNGSDTETSSTDEATPSKKIDLEITNPEDTDLEDDGQGKLF
ncbi:DNA gyrase/topoisomerase IV subunit A [Solitalea sp. MAHUQ-68]|uniref:DNA gyrase/topoisomerase IV subunit A n=1 Tax=Solitalea agri TaxID=2953739 RepID=A0A9X2F545_9SPHI|nr:DNA gyrase/topoisomerase IV subunit A [Solitalea agri]MCO4292501.1 DNA gyrase/topoisomerase IV subunit A [Solitalea agri]